MIDEVFNEDIFDINDMYYADGSLNPTIWRQFYFPLTKKYGDTLRETVIQEYSTRNAYIIRLAEMYLIAAEAAMEQGNNTSAFNYLKILADARSYTGDGAALLASYGINSGSDVDLDFILDERARELAGEHFRWFDLKRTGTLLNRVRLYNPDEKDNIQSHHNLRPIPQDMVDQGYPQNPGY